MVVDIYKLAVEWYGIKLCGLCLELPAETGNEVA